MEATATQTQVIINHHLEAFIQNDLNELLQDYTEQSEVWTPDGILTGLTAISSFYANAFQILPSGKTKLDLKQMIVAENKAYLVWSADSPIVSVPIGTDSFEMEGDKIIWQSLAAQIIQK